MTTIGITFDLRSQYLKEGYGELETAEFDSEETVENIEESLRELGHVPERIGNFRDLMRALEAGRRWDLVFNICEGLYGFGREAQVPALLDGFRIPYTFSDPLVLALTLHKGMTKHVARDLGLPTPDFHLVAAPEDIDAVKLAYPLFAKPVAEGSGKGVDASSRVGSAAALREVCMRLLRDFDQPVLVERYLPGREFTAGILGSGAAAVSLGAMEVILRADAEPNAYSMRNKEHYEELVEYQPVEPAVLAACEAVSLPLWRKLGCRDAGRVDLKMDADGRVHFLEVNPLAGLNRRRSDLSILSRMRGMTYVELIGGIINSALARARPKR